MKVLIAGEESQSICVAFRKRGHEAFSCDIKPCSGGHPEWHLQCDCTKAIILCFWDLIIFHPDCTCLAVSGNRWYGKGTIGYNNRVDAINWTVNMWELIKKHSSASCLENPISVIFKYLSGAVLQYIQPWQFGHAETKKTGLYLRNLPKLQPTNIVSGREHKIWKMAPSPERKELRSKTFHGVAEAIASQWGRG